MTKRISEEKKASFGVNASIPDPADVAINLPPNSKWDGADEENPTQGSSKIQTPGQPARGSNSRARRSVGSPPKEPNVAQGSSKVSAPGQTMQVTAEDIDLSDDIAALFEGADLSEDFQERAKVIFEAAVVSKINEALEEISEEVEQEIEEAKEALKEEFTEKLDTYLDYVIEQWMQENRLAVTTGIRGELAESFISGLKTLFQEHYVSIPDEELDILEQMAERIEDLEESLNNEIETNIELSERVSEYEKDMILSDVAEGLTDVEASKLETLAEGVSYSDADEFREKLEVLRESYFNTGGKVTGRQSFDFDYEPVELNEETEVPANMKAYTQTISRTVKGKK
jgi:F0F1-type ATP synthase delta subunit